MHTYHYKYTIDKVTKDRLESLQPDEWIIQFKRILENKSLDFNLEFSYFEPLPRLKTLYAAMVTNKIDTIYFQEALVNIFQQLYPVPELADQSVVVISLIDYVRPAAYFSRLIPFVVNPTYSYMKGINAPNGLSLHLYLINAIMSLDLRHILLAYLKSLAEFREKKIPEYYQITLRYMYTYSNEDEFSSFMKVIYLDMKDDNVLRLVKFTLLESIKATSSFSYVFMWISGQYLELKLLDKELLRDLLLFLNDWISKKAEKAGHYAFYQSFALLLNAIKLCEYKIWPSMETVTWTYGGMKLHKKTDAKLTAIRPTSGTANNFMATLALISGINERSNYISGIVQTISLVEQIEKANNLSQEDWLIEEN